MSLVAGTRLGPYEVLAPIGAGGMGEVYCARDTKLKRDVALKVLPAVAAVPVKLAVNYNRSPNRLAVCWDPLIDLAAGPAQPDRRG